MDSNLFEVEKESPRYIRLVEPNDILQFDSNAVDGNYHFESPEKLIPHLGRVHIWGSKFNTEFTIEEDTVIYIENGQTKTGKGKDLEPILKNMFEISISIKAKVPPEFRCKLKLGNLLELESNLEADKDELEPNPEEQYWSIEKEWKQKDGKTYRFFGPADPNFLSQLEFSFYTNFPQLE
jgi:hypothetical protein